MVGRRYTELGQPINNFTWLPRTRHWVSSAGLRVSVIDGLGNNFLSPKTAAENCDARQSPLSDALAGFAFFGGSGESIRQRLTLVV